MINTEAQTAYDKGVYLIEADKACEAVKVLATAVRLMPENAEYRAELAHAYNLIGNYLEAKKEASRAVEIDPKSAYAYAQLGYAYLETQHYSDSVENMSKAIEIDPVSDNYYAIRAMGHEAMRNYEKAFSDYAHHYYTSKDTPNQWTGMSNEYNSWCERIHKHLMSKLWPMLGSDNGTYVAYWPCYIKWGQHSKVKGDRERVYTMDYSTFGSGYLCLTTKNVYLFSMGDISRDFPLYSQGLFSTFIGIGLAHQNNRMSKVDQSWSIPYPTITGIQIVNDKLRLVTRAMDWELSGTFKGHLSQMNAGISVGMAGKYLSHSSVPSRIDTAPKEDSIELLKRLGELRAQGIISEVEFEQKKKDILSRL